MILKLLLSLLIISLIQCSSYIDGWKTVNSKDKDIIRIAEIAVNKIDLRSNSLYTSALLYLNHTTIKLNKGLFFKFQLGIGRLSCMKGPQKIVGKKCIVTHKEDCQVTFSLKPWAHSERIESMKCTPFVKVHDAPTATPTTRATVPSTTPTPTTKTHSTGKATTTTFPPHDNSKAIIIAMKNVAEPDKAFKTFKTQFKKIYKDSATEIQKFAIFKENLQSIVKLQQTEKGSAVYGPTEFSDLSLSEFAAQRLSPVWDLNKAALGLTSSTTPDVTPPPAFDWRDHKAVTGVKNQESCGSCWAFSTTGNIEGQFAIKNKKLESFSEQELVDCDKVDQGCNGGLPSQAYQEIIRIGGLESETDYPYEARGEKCNFTKRAVDVKLSGAVNISTNEGDMAAWLFKNGPISIGINANGMQFYMGGISHPWKILCNPQSLDHGVLIVGYGVRKSEPYWIVKNSWGPSWGEKGYYLVYRGAGVCGLNLMPTSAVIA